MHIHQIFLIFTSIYIFKNGYFRLMIYIISYQFLLENKDEKNSDV